MADQGNLRRYRRDDIADAALRILDNHGLADLTMRRLAAALEVQPSALYWHFENKQSLLAELADRIVDRSRVSIADATVAGWRTAICTEAAALRDALLAYRDGAEVVSSTYALGLGSGRTLHRFTDAVAKAGFDEVTSRRAAAALLHFVLGHVSHEQQRLQYDSLGVLAEGTDALDENPKAAFEFGVDLLMDGLAFSRARSETRGEI